MSYRVGVVDSVVNMFPVVSGQSLSVFNRFSKVEVYKVRQGSEVFGYILGKVFQAPYGKAPGWCFGVWPALLKPGQYPASVSLVSKIDVLQLRIIRETTGCRLVGWIKKHLGVALMEQGA